MRALSASKPWGASQTSPRRGSTLPGFCGSATTTGVVSDPAGAARVSSSSPPIADTVGRRGAVLALPNLLSLFRIAIVPVVVVLLAWTDPLPRALAAALFVVACITDYFDGWLARRRQSTTVLGQFLDPLADKLLVAAVLIMLAA